MSSSLRSMSVTRCSSIPSRSVVEALTLETFGFERYAAGENIRLRKLEAAEHLGLRIADELLDSRFKRPQSRLKFSAKFGASDGGVVVVSHASPQ